MIWDEIWNGWIAHEFTHFKLNDVAMSLYNIMWWDVASMWWTYWCMLCTLAEVVEVCVLLQHAFFCSPSYHMHGTQHCENSTVRAGSWLGFTPLVCADPLGHDLGSLSWPGSWLGFTLLAWVMTWVHSLGLLGKPWLLVHFNYGLLPHCVHACTCLLRTLALHATSFIQWLTQSKLRANPEQTQSKPRAKHTKAQYRHQLATK